MKKIKKSTLSPNKQLILIAQNTTKDCPQNQFKNLFLKYLTYTASRDGEFFITTSTDMPNSCVAQAEISKNLIVLNKNLINFKDIAKFFEGILFIEHELAHITDYHKNGMYQKNENNFGRTSEGILAQDFERIYPNFPSIYHEFGKQFTSALYLTSAEEVIARELALQHTKTFCDAIKTYCHDPETKKLADEFWNFEYNQEKLIMENLTKFVAKNKHLAKNLYNHYTNKFIKQKNFKHLDLLDLCAMQDHHIFFSKKNYHNLFDFACLHNLPEAKLILQNSKYAPYKNTEIMQSLQDLKSVFTDKEIKTLYEQLYNINPQTLDKFLQYATPGTQQNFEQQKN